MEEEEERNNDEKKNLYRKALESTDDTQHMIKKKLEEMGIEELSDD